MDKPEIDPKTGLWKEPQPYDFSIGAGNTAYENDGLDYEVDYMSSSADYMADIDDIIVNRRLITPYINLSCFDKIII